MYLEKLRLINFKNYEDIEFAFNDEINCIVGKNGAGKTNILDAIHYLSVTKGFVTSADNLSIRQGASFFTILGNFEKGENQISVKCQLQQGDKKNIAVNNNSYEKISDHIGLLPVVLMAPYDTDLIRGGSEIRRKFFDGVISQISQHYLVRLLQYKQALRQRNALLKQFYQSSNVNEDLIEPYDQLIIRLGKLIYEQRKSFTENIIPKISDHYKDISGEQEEISIKYLTDYSKGDFEKRYRNAFKHDVFTSRTSMGIHKDDYNFEMNGTPVRKTGSQGQQKSLVIAIKLAQFDIMRETNNYKPILLMDDLFDKLDEGRMSKIINLVAGHAFGQIFVTDARPERTISIFKEIDATKTIFEIKDNRAFEILKT